ncbi:MAG: 2Fe-2S iron-sulfur cluster-binding protein [Bacteroidota bacterium]|nr:2Fe-2S iron-sulfur cluster-binding protein [Bacteroidota bacterium]
MQHSYKVKIKDIQRETEDCVSVAFEIPDDLKSSFIYKQGQYITLIKQIGDEEIHRSYSLCSSPHENEWRVAIKKVALGKFSTFANETLQVGDDIELMVPNGKFFTELLPENTKSYLFFAAGSGITPIISNIKSILLNEPFSQVQLIYGTPRTDHIIFKEQLLGLKNLYLARLHLHFILSREITDEPLFHGRIDADKLMRFEKKLFHLDRVDEIFICGPESMIFDLKNTFIGLGFPEKHIHFELFGTTSPPEKIEISQKLTGHSCSVTLKLDGRTISFKLPYGTDSILDAALKQRANLPFACKGGVCSTCKARLIQGEVKMARNYALEQDELDAGYILTCQSFPISDEVNIDFDQ